MFVVCDNATDRVVSLLHVQTSADSLALPHETISNADKILGLLRSAVRDDAAINVKRQSQNQMDEK